MDRFLKEGGRVQVIDPGISGRTDGAPSIKTPIFNQPKEPRTPLNDVVEALDKRREDKKAAKRAPRASRGPKKKIIYDDFGEPLRTVWIDPSS